MRLFFFSNRVSCFYLGFPLCTSFFETQERGTGTPCVGIRTGLPRSRLRSALVGRWRSKEPGEDWWEAPTGALRRRDGGDGISGVEGSRLTYQVLARHPRHLPSLPKELSGVLGRWSSFHSFRCPWREPQVSRTYTLSSGASRSPLGATLRSVLHRRARGGRVRLPGGRRFLSQESPRGSSGLQRDFATED